MTGAIIWFTGLPASGKSTLADHVQRRISSAGRCAIMLDGDAVRNIVTGRSYDAVNRDEHYRVLANLAALIAKQGALVLVPATAPKREHRDYARRTGCRFIEVFVRTPLAVCELRDIKRLYATARRDPASTLPGIGVPYEVSVAPDVVADGGQDECAAETVAALACHERRLLDPSFATA